MSVFRIEKNKNYTAMSNYHFQDMNLSLKAMGLLSLMLSLPDTWDYSQAGLAKIVKDGADSISSALKELEKNGYLVRVRERDESGRMGAMMYYVYEVPKQLMDKYGTAAPEPPIKKRKTTKKSAPKQGLPKRENPVLDNPILDAPDLDSPAQDAPDWEAPTQAVPTRENQSQYNTKKDNTHVEITEEVSTEVESTSRENTYQENTYNFSEPIDPSIPDAREQNFFDGTRDGSKREFEYYQEMKRKVKNLVNYDFFVYQKNNLDEALENGTTDIDHYDEDVVTCNLRVLDAIVSYIVDTLVSKSYDPIRINGEFVSRQVVKERLMKVDMLKVKDVMRALHDTDVKNPKNYTISMLFNA